MNKRLVLIGFLLALGLTLACAQKLPLSSSSVKVDGLISDNEYSLAVPLDKVEVYLTRTADTLFLGLSAPTKGWVAVGLGSDRMDGARLFIGAVTDGTASLSEQLGTGHSHSGSKDHVVVSYAMVEGTDRAVLELSLRAGEVIPVGQNELQLLAAFGGTDEISGYHTFRGRLAVQLD
jgi:hypothetical protein